MAIDYPALAAEIANDPKTLGYAGKSDYAIAVILNTVGASAETVIRAYTNTAEIVAAIDPTEFTALAAASKLFLTDVILAAPVVKTGDANLRTAVGQIFGAGATRTRLIAAASKSASRAEVLFGEGISVNDTDVAKALGRG